MEMLEKAKMIGCILHCTAKYDEFDYEKHLADVEAVLCRFGVDDEDLLSAAWLHDTVEDTQMKLALIAKYFNVRVMQLVYAVTNETGINRKERNQKTYIKLAGNNDAIKLKLADRIANVEHGLKKDNTSIVDMYRKENTVFEYNLKNDSQDETTKKMFEHLKTILMENK